MSKTTTPSEMLRLIADAFDRQGWALDLTTGLTLVAEIDRTGGVNSATLAKRVPATFVERNRTSRPVVATVIERAVGGRTVKREDGGQP